MNKNEKELKIPNTLENAPVFSSKEQAERFYCDFLESVRKKTYDSKLKLEKHHVIPKHAGGPNTQDNLILVSIEEHVLLHYYRFLAYDQYGDRLAYLFRLSDTEERAKLRSETVVENHRKAERLFWNSEWQRKQGLKGGSKGGLANTKKQFLARQRLGKAYGAKVGRSNQSESLKQIIKCFIAWQYKNSFTGECTVFETEPAKTAIEIISQLNRFKPESIRKSSSFMKVFHGKRPQMYGWSIIDMVIRSEAEEV